MTANNSKINIKPDFYIVEINRAIWNIPKYYQDLTPVATGAYGFVWLVQSN